ncbi:hypothetical protein [Lacticaseibacillus daqingensis]|uniref:hypothetical protein n=1 Tax=Lacticaseibacillus daqingensis TaxID=2486014 RepID=UPI000F76CF77|nr:hypothetical protein [Lacticaseibacillus daqingensis]
MHWMTILLVGVLVVATGAVVLVRRSLQFVARPKRAWQIGYLTLAGLMTVLTAVTSKTLDAAVSGGFIVGMCLVFAAWRRGLTRQELINGFGSMRPYSQLTQIQLTALPQGTQLQARVGQVVVVTLVFAQAPATLAQFLKRQMPPERVVML